MSDSDVMTAPAVQEAQEITVKDVAPPTFQELKAQIQEGLDAYRKREAALADIRQALNKARQEEAAALKRSLDSDDSKVIVAKARVAIEVQSRRIAVAEQSRGGGLDEIVNLLLQQISSRQVL